LSLNPAPGVRQRKRLKDWLPRGGMLPDEAWAPRHRWILKVLWFHVVGLGAASALQGNGLSHTLFEMSLVASFGVAAALTSFHRRASTLFASLGLLTASAVLVHLFEGRIEMHFSYFVMVGVVTLYQDWLPLLASIGYVVLQHGIGGMVDPAMVYNHSAAIDHPWTWAGIHGGFILAMSAVGLISWRMNETFQARLAEREARLAEAQTIACLGSWSVDLISREVEWSDEFRRLLQLDADDLQPSVEAFLTHVSLEDRARLEAHILAALRDGTPFEQDFRVLPSTGGVRWLHGRGDAKRNADGKIVVVSGTVQDITARKHAEFGRDEMLSQLAATFDSTADGILVVSTVGLITNLNARFMSLFGLDAALVLPIEADAVLSKVLPQLEDPAEFVRSVAQFVDDPDARTEFVLKLLDGRTFECCCIPQTVHGHVVGRVWSVRDMTERTKLESALTHQAFHDSLTNLANKALFHDRVSHALARAERDAGSIAILFIDLDGFKTINDGLGHTVGDQLLVAVADRLLACLRASDTAARLGGDEFAVLIEDIAVADHAEMTAHRLVGVLQDPFHVAQRDVYVRASIGIAYGDDGATFEQLLRHADLAMYSAKRHGRNRYETYTPGAHADPLAKLDLETAMRRGLAMGEFSVHYQPVVVLPAGDVVGAEALARWNSADHGSISPETFIPLAEDLGLISEIGERVLSVACAQLREWQLEKLVSPEFSMSVNLSTKQLEEHDLVGRVAAALHHSGLPARNLVLEITESGLMRDDDRNAALLSELRELGVRIAIDDFGTGYSSLSYLQNFPVDILKIDRTFVAAINAGSPDTSLAPTIVALADTLNLRVIAEGVETALQADTLSALGCQLAQGFLFARPLSSDAMRELLERDSSSSDAYAPRGIVRVSGA
jgi:diguanylate cyclase (GGDEF)-like protein/PAS domain S-box-containing protein